jgi:hypothetical protein
VEVDASCIGTAILHAGRDCGFAERPEYPGDQSPGYSTTPHKWGSEAGFIRRRLVARALMPARRSAICSRVQYISCLFSSLRHLEACEQATFFCLREGMLEKKEGDD